MTAERKKELAGLIGDENCPSIEDIIDIHAFFNPITLFKDKDGSLIEFDYNKYLQAEEVYATILKDANDTINEKMASTSTASKLQEELEKGGKKSSKSKKTVKNSSISDDVIIRLPEYLQDQYSKWAKYFGRMVPSYNKYTCTCCGAPRELKDYYLRYGETDIARIEMNGKMHTHICMDCCKKIYEYIFFEKANKDAIEAMKWFCSYLNIYFDEASYLSAKKKMDEKIEAKKSTHIVDEYMSIINESASLKGKVFLESPDIGFGGVKGDKKDARIINSSNGSVQDDIEEGWTKAELEAKRQVVKMVGYDPFYYQVEKNRKQLYKDLINMLDDGEMDGLRITAASQIVLSFLKIREIEELYRKKWEENAPVTELKALTDLKTKELDTITKFSRDNGFGERYQVAKSSGSNSFTGIMAKMNELKYSNGLINKYDIETSATIQQAADASFQAIFNQLNLSEAEIYKTCQEQLKKLIDLQHVNASLEEQLRLTKKELAELKLAEKKRLQDIEDEKSNWGGY